MKKILFLSMFVFSAFAGIVAQNAAPSMISGVWNRPGSNEVSLFYTINGRLEKLATYNLKADKAFTFAFAHNDEGFYVIGTGRPETKAEKFTFYFKPGDKLNLTVNANGTYTLDGENTVENIAMTEWYNYALPLTNGVFTNYSQTYVDYFPILEEKTATPYVPESTDNPVFDNAFAKYRKFELMHCATNFILTPRSAQPEGEDFPDYYRTIKFSDITNNTDVLKYYPYSIFKNVYFIDCKMSGEKMQSPQALIDFAENDTVKGELYLALLSTEKDLPVKNDLDVKYSAYVITPDQKNRLQKEDERLNKLYIAQGLGKPGHNFTYKDIDGKDVSFADFKGKVVYVDVWATWCGPCRKQLPHMKAMEEKFHNNKDIAFVSVSTDKASDIQKWKDFVAKEKLTGVQLHTNNGADDDIMKLYQISGIPRFLLFDKAGNIVSINAPEPSSPELEPMLMKLLK